MSEPCPFCDSAIVLATFAETDHLLALCDLFPLLPGHSLIVPKRHVMRAGDLTTAEGASFMGFAATVAGVLMDVYGCTGYDLSLQEGSAAGQTVMHVHMHVIPRKAGDLQDRNWHRQLLDSRARARLEPEAMAAEVTRLRMAMAGIRA